MNRYDVDPPKRPKRSPDSVNMQPVTVGELMRGLLDSIDAGLATFDTLVLIHDPDTDWHMSVHGVETPEFHSAMCDGPEGHLVLIIQDYADKMIRDERELSRE